MENKLIKCKGRIQRVVSPDGRASRLRRLTLVSFKGGVIGEPWFPYRERSKENRRFSFLIWYKHQSLEEHEHSRVHRYSDSRVQHSVWE